MYSIVNPCLVSVRNRSLGAALIVDSVHLLFKESLSCGFNPPKILQDSIIKEYDIYFKVFRKKLYRLNTSLL
jgi:hypothetical protein